MNYLLIPLIVCFFIPSIAIGYGYSTISCNLLQFPFLHKCLYAVIMIGRLMGPAAVILFFIPSPLSDASRHCMRMRTPLKSHSGDTGSTIKKTISSSISRIRELQYLLLVNIWRYIFVFIFIFIAAFSEFELASIMNIENWSVSLFDAHAQGIDFLSSLKVNFLPFILQSIMSIILLYSLSPLSRRLPSFHEKIPLQSLSQPTHGYLRKLLNIYISNSSSLPFHIALFIFLFSMIISGFPLVVIIRSALKGKGALLSLWMLKEILHSLLFATFATTAAYLFTLFCHYKFLMKYKFLILLVFLPVLTGILPLSLLILEFFQLPGLNHLYNSPLPLITALILQALPFALLLRIVADMLTKEESTHSALLTLPFASHTAGTLLWKMHYLKTAWIFFVIFTVTYFNFTASAILAPVGMTTVTERLYNLMHYGESEKLSATLLITILIPLFLFLIFAIIFKLVIKKRLSRKCI